MRIAFLGSRGIPANYGGLETFVEEISTRLVEKGHVIYVVCQSDRFYEDEYHNIKRVHVPRIFKTELTIPVIHSLIATIYFLLHHFNDIDIFFYVNAGGSIPAIIARTFGKKIIINTDGIEWKRMKKRKQFVPFFQKISFSFAEKILYFLESLSCMISHITIADSQAIKSYLKEKHNAKHVHYIPYGARILLNDTTIEHENKILKKYNLKPDEYYLTVARIVAENNIDMEIEGFKNSNSKRKLVIIGNFSQNDPYSQFLKQIKENDNNILFFDPIYDKEVIGVLRKNCYAYIHAYEVGGTNPSLLEQMLYNSPILTFNINFNKEVLKESGIYFDSFDNLSTKILELESNEYHNNENKELFRSNLNSYYNWKSVTDNYEKLLDVN